MVKIETQSISLIDLYMIAHFPGLVQALEYENCLIKWVVRSQALLLGHQWVSHSRTYIEYIDNK